MANALYLLRMLLWASLSKLYISKNTREHDDLEYELSNSVLVLFGSYPGDPRLRQYLEQALKDELISLPVYITTMLQATRTPALQNLSTVDIVCRIALLFATALKMSGMSQTAILLDNSPASVSSKVLDALALVNFCRNSLPSSSIHPAFESSSQLVILLLSCLSDISQVPPNQAMLLHTEASGPLQDFRLSEELRQILAPFVWSLSIVIGNDSKAAKEAQTMHSVQLAIGKTEIHGPTTQSDTVTFSMVVQNLVMVESSTISSPVQRDPVAAFVAMLRWTAWTPSAFYSQLLVSVFTCLSQARQEHTARWRAFILGRLPSLLVTFEHTVRSESQAAETEWNNALQIALMSLLRRSDLLQRCDRKTSSCFPKSEALEAPRSIFRELLQQLLRFSLIEQAVAVSMDPSVSNSVVPSLHSEAQDMGMDIKSYLEGQLSVDVRSKECALWLDRLWQDSSSHTDFVQLVHSRFETLASALDAEGMSQLCQLMYMHDIPLRIISLHDETIFFLFHSLGLLEQYNWEIVGDPQSAFSQLGDVILFVQTTMARFHIRNTNITLGDKSYSTAFLRLTSAAALTEMLEDQYVAAFGAWFKALFDPNSEGIGDALLRSTQPKLLLRIAPVIIENAINAFFTKKMDQEALNNGVSFFVGPLLNWTLVGVVRYLARDIQRKIIPVQIHWHLLYTFLTSNSCPKPVLWICGAQVLQVFNHKRFQKDSPQMLHRRSESVRRIKAANASAKWDTSVDAAWMEQPKAAIHSAVALTRAGKAPMLDVARCVAIVPQMEFLQLLWGELVNTSSLGEMETCRRIVATALILPTPGPPLLPMFIYHVLPAAFALVEQRASEQAVTVEHTVSVVSAALNALLQLERAYRLLHNEDRPILGESAASLARGFAAFLRSGKRGGSSICGPVASKLEALKSFTANFPLFVSELGSRK